jgi:hypothetical protein
VTLIAAVVLVVSFLVGPFVQQASRTARCIFSTQGQNATIPYANYVPRGNAYTAPSGVIPYALPYLRVAILSSATAPDGVENQVTPDCSTGTCTFHDADGEDPDPLNSTEPDSSTHSTVGMRNACVNVERLVARTMVETSNGLGPLATRYALPNGLNITQGSYVYAKIEPSSDLRWMGDLLTSELRIISRWAYANATFLATSNNEKVTAAAVCTLYPCLRTYAASVKNNKLSEKLISPLVMNNLEVSPSTMGNLEYKLSPKPETFNDKLRIMNSYKSDLFSVDGVDYLAFRSPCNPASQLVTSNLTIPLNTTTITVATSLTPSTPSYATYPPHDPAHIATPMNWQQRSPIYSPKSTSTHRAQNTRAPSALVPAASETPTKAACMT